MESLEVIARPHFGKDDLAWLTDIRSRRAGSRGAPYFTLVFPGADLTPQRYVEKVRLAVAEVQHIRFRLRSALVAPEPVVGRFHVFLIPDEGFGAINRLHELLHLGALEAALRRDVPYLPHITVATGTDQAAMRKLALALNQRGIDIAGHIEGLEVEEREGEVIRKIADVPLKHGWFS